MAGDMDISELVDERPLRPLQIMTIALCAVVAVLDGIDTQSIGIAAPAMAGELHIAPSAFGQVFGAALVGAMVGALALGSFGDKYGRKRVLVLSTLVFAIFTFATPFATSFPMLLALRFAAGLGLGGATPAFVALTAEYAPLRFRGLFVGLQYAAFPLGGMTGGFLGSFLLTHYGWHSIFYVGGVLPLFLAIVLQVFLPESLRYLVTKPDRDAAIARIVGRLDPTIPMGTRFKSTEEKLPGLPLRHLFTEGRSIVTPLLWVPFFMSFSILIFIPLWAPSLLKPLGIPVQDASFVVALDNLGAVIGMSASGFLIDRFGVYRVLLIALFLGAAATAGVGLCTHDFALLAAVTTLSGLFVGASGSGIIVLAATVYPTPVRSTGLGWALAMAKLGQVVGPFLGGVMVARSWAIGPIFLAVACAAVLAFVAVLSLRSLRSPSESKLAVRVSA